MQGRNILDQLSSTEDTVLKLCLYVPVSKQILKTEFWVNYKKKKKKLYCFASQKGTQWAPTSKTMCPNQIGLEELYSSDSRMGLLRD